VTTAVALALYLGIATPREHAASARAAADVASRDQTIADLRARADAIDARARALEADLASARAAATSLQSQLDEANRRVAQRGGRAPLGPAPARSGGPRLDGFTTCPPGSKDPLCLR
jgi:hypothetical protein